MTKQVTFLSEDETNQLIDIILSTEGIHDNSKYLSPDQVGEIIGKSLAFAAMAIDYKLKRPNEEMDLLFQFLMRVDDILGIHHDMPPVSIN